LGQVSDTRVSSFVVNAKLLVNAGYVLISIVGDGIGQRNAESAALLGYDRIFAF
jgi:hypothetical protein